jgi:hypothetical protein
MSRPEISDPVLEATVSSWNLPETRRWTASHGMKVTETGLAVGEPYEEPVDFEGWELLGQLGGWDVDRPGFVLGAMVGPVVCASINRDQMIEPVFAAAAWYRGELDKLAQRADVEAADSAET